MSSTSSSDPVGLRAADDLVDTHTGPAEALTVADFRRSVGSWLNHYLELDEERLADVVLATDEAMSNCVDHAYRIVDYVGTMTLQIAYNRVTYELTVSVSDQGHWMEPTTSASNARGRGILLMRALADDCSIKGGQDGTTVCLRFYDCPPSSYILSRAS